MSEPWTGCPPPPPFPPSHIQAVAAQIYSDYARAVGRERLLSRGVLFRELYEEVLYPLYEIGLEEGHELGFAVDGEKILASFDVDANVVLVDQCIGPNSGDPRRTFTLHHEVIGHGVLQGKWLRDQRAAGHLGLVMTTDQSICSPTLDRLEKQANAIAALTAAPTEVVIAAIAATYRPTKRFRFLRPCHYCLTPHGQTHRVWVDNAQELCACIAFHIRDRFDGLSTEALGYRVASIRLVDDRSMPLVLYRTGAPSRRSSPSLAALDDDRFEQAGPSRAHGSCAPRRVVPTRWVATS